MSPESGPLTDSYWPAEEGDAVRDATLGELLREAAAAVPDRLALVDGVEDQSARQEWTYAEFLQDAERVARALLKRFQPGDRVAIWAPNSAHWIILQQGISLAGMILVAANPAYRSRELEHILSNSGAAGLFYDALLKLSPPWTSQPVQMQAQHVEQSEFSDGSNYLKNLPAATAITSALLAGQPAAAATIQPAAGPTSDGGRYDRLSRPPR